MQDLNICGSVDVSMNIGVIGPTKIDIFCRLRGVSKDYFIKAVQFVAARLAASDHTFYIVPDAGSTVAVFAKHYREYNGKKLIGLVPENDTEFGNSWLDRTLTIHIENTGTWRNTPEELVRNADVLLCFGLGLGTMIEVAYSKWFHTNKIYFIKEFVPVLPVELTHKIHCQWVSLAEIPALLK